MPFSSYWNHIYMLVNTTTCLTENILIHHLFNKAVIRFFWHTHLLLDFVHKFLYIVLLQKKHGCFDELTNAKKKFCLLAFLLIFKSGKLVICNSSLAIVFEISTHYFFEKLSDYSSTMYHSRMVNCAKLNIYFWNHMYNLSPLDFFDFLKNNLCRFLHRVLISWFYYT